MKQNWLQKNDLNKNTLVFIIFIILFIIQWLLVRTFQDLNIAFAASLIYLPHGLRVLSTLIGGTKILPGLFLGHVVSGFFLHYAEANFGLIEMVDNITLKNIIIIILTSLGSTYSVILSIYFLKFNYKIIENITLKMIFIISILSSIINSFFTNSIYYISYNSWQIGMQFFQYIIGDLIGAFIIFYFLKYLNKYIKYNFTDKG